MEKLRGKTVEWSRSPDVMFTNGRGSVTDFGAVETAGAVRLTHDAEGLLITALPESSGFTVKVRWSELPWKLRTPHVAEALDEDGNVLGTDSLALSGGIIALKYHTGMFQYRLR